MRLLRRRWFSSKRALSTNRHFRPMFDTDETLKASGLQGGQLKPSPWT